MKFAPIRSRAPHSNYAGTGNPQARRGRLPRSGRQIRLILKLKVVVRPDGFARKRRLPDYPKDGSPVADGRKIPAPKSGNRPAPHGRVTHLHERGYHHQLQLPCPGLRPDTPLDRDNRSAGDRRFENSDTAGTCAITLISTGLSGRHWAVARREMRWAALPEEAERPDENHTRVRRLSSRIRAPIP